MTQLPSALLHDPRYRSVHERRERHAAEARKAQKRYHRLIRGFIAASSAAAVIGGLVLYGTEASPPDATAEQVNAGLRGFVSDPDVRSVLFFLQAIAVGTVGFCAYVLNAQDYGRVWREHRAKAEELRQQLALMALEIGHEQGPEAFRAAGHRFVAEMIDGQIDYLSGAATGHGEKSFRLTLLGGVIIAVGVGAPILATAGLPSLILIGSLAAIVTPALLSGLKSWNEATASSARKSLHDATLDLLQSARSRQKELEAALDAHDLDAARAYAGLVFDALQTDVDGFLKIMTGAPKPPPPSIPASDQ